MITAETVDSPAYTRRDEILPEVLSNYGDCVFELFVFEHSPCPNELDGMIQIVAFGGTPPYTFSSSSGTLVQNGFAATISDLGVGDVGITIIDDNDLECSITVNLPAIEIEITVTAESCPGAYDGSVTMCISGNLWGHIYQPFFANSYLTYEEIIANSSGTWTYPDPNDPNYLVECMTVTGLDAASLVGWELETCQLKFEETIPLDCSDNCFDIAFDLYIDYGCPGLAAIELIPTFFMPYTDLSFDWDGPGNFDGNTEDVLVTESGTYSLVVYVE